MDSAVVEPGDAMPGASRDVPEAPLPVEGFNLVHHVIAAQLTEAVVVLGPDRRVVIANESASLLFGQTVRQLQGMVCCDPALAVRLEEKARRTMPCLVDAAMRREEPISVAGWVRRVDGASRAVQVRVAPILTSTGVVEGTVVVLEDVTDLLQARASHEVARSGAVKDPVCGLPGRVAAQLVIAMRQGDLERHRLTFGLLIVEPPQPPLGTASPDHAARTMATVLRRVLRSGDLLARWDDDTFAVVAAHTDADGLARLADRLVQAARRVVPPLPGGPRPPVAVGGCLAQPGLPVQDLIAAAEQGRLSARASGIDVLLVSRREPSASAPRLLGAAR